MIYSMTAFARRAIDTEWGELTWELRTVNHRYLDVNLKLPEELRAFETVFRQSIQGRVRRGRVDGLLRMQWAALAGGGAEIDLDASRRLKALAERIGRIHTAAPPLTVVDVLNWPGVLKVNGPDTEQLAAAARTLLDATLAELADNRGREGAQLKTLVSERVIAAQAILATLAAALPAIAGAVRRRLDERLAEVREQFDQGRIEQEVVLLLSKSDAGEEIDRIGVHLDEVQRVLASAASNGRRLDFLMQELNREANTLGAKAADMRVTNASVELKVLIDQMREQIQNIE